MSANAFVGEINISAPRARVWEVLSTPKFASQWVGAFGDDSLNFSGEWKEGAEWLTFNADGDGVVARAARCETGSFAEFEYVAALKKHERQEFTDENAAWKEARDSFALSDANQCTLSVLAEHPDAAMREFLAEKWPLVLQKIKELSESDSSAAENCDGN